jgi:hypothetical protein
VLANVGIIAGIVVGVITLIPVIWFIRSKLRRPHKIEIDYKNVILAPIETRDGSYPNGKLALGFCVLNIVNRGDSAITLKSIRLKCLVDGKLVDTDSKIIGVRSSFLTEFSRNNVKNDDPVVSPKTSILRCSRVLTRRRKHCQSRGRNGHDTQQHAGETPPRPDSLTQAARAELRHLRRAWVPRLQLPARRLNHKALRCNAYRCHPSTRVKSHSWRFAVTALQTPLSGNEIRR